MSLIYTHKIWTTIKWWSQLSHNHLVSLNVVLVMLIFISLAKNSKGGERQRFQAASENLKIKRHHYFYFRNWDHYAQNFKSFVEENDLTLVDAALKYNVSTSRIGVWLRIARTQGLNALSITKPRGRPLKNAMGRPKKKKPEEMTELERLRYENECLRAENALLKKVKALVEAREARLKEIGRKPSKN